MMEPKMTKEGGVYIHTNLFREVLHTLTGQQWW